MSQTPQRQDPLIGTVVAGKYRIEQRIARGGMGAVYLAVHEYMERKVALKVLHKHLAEQSNADVFFKRFLREARTASQINHPNAVTIYDFGVVDDLPYLAMEFLDGRSLTSILIQEKRLSWKRALPLITQICGAIEAAHALKIAHRDIKPDNIIIKESADGIESAHVLDFGIAKGMEGSATMAGTMTAVGKTVGTPRYMSPEQAMGKTIDLRTDVYSLGVVFYEMLAGEIPFAADSPVQLMYEHLHSPPKDLPKGLDHPAGVDAVIKRALAKAAADRYSSPQDFADALASLDGQAATLNKRTPNTSSTNALDWRMVVAVALLLAGAVTGLAIYQGVSESSLNSTQTTQPALEQTEEVAAETVSDPLPTEGVVEAAADSEIDKQVAEAVEPSSENKNPPPAAVLPEPAKAVKNLALQPDPANINSDSPEIALSHSDAAMIAEQEPSQKPTALPPANTGAPSRNEAPTASAETELLVLQLGSESREERIAAALALQQLGKEPVPLLLYSLQNDPSPRVRYLAAFLLGKLNAVEAIPVLEETTKDNSGMVAETAKRALLHLKTLQ